MLFSALVMVFQDSVVAAGSLASGGRSFDGLWALAVKPWIVWPAGVVGTGLCALGIELWRRRGNMVVSLDYPENLRGTFSVRLRTNQRAARELEHRPALPDRGRRASTRNEHSPVIRDTQFWGLLPQRYWVVVDGVIFDPTTHAPIERHFEVAEVVVRTGESARLEFDLCPSGAPIIVQPMWDQRPLSEALVAVCGQPLSLCTSGEDPARLMLPVGRHRIMVGSRDRVAERNVKVEGFSPIVLDVELGGQETVVFKGCPQAVTPYLSSDFDKAIRALHHEGQREVATRLEARLHEEAGERLQAAAIYQEAGDWNSAALLLQRTTPGSLDYGEACRILSEHFAQEGQLAAAIAKMELAIFAAEPGARLTELQLRLAELLVDADDDERAFEVLGVLSRGDPDFPGINTQIENIRKRMSFAEGITGTMLVDSVVASESADEAGDGRYQLFEQIGAGGMAIVFRARDRILGREVALKRLADNLQNQPVAVELFRREARSAALLNHPNIVTLFDVGEHDGTLFLTMEFLKGRTLADLCRAPQPVGVSDVIEIAQQIAAGLKFAHSQRIVHRDIKPANLFQTDEGVVKIMDFGLAKVVEEVKRSSSIIGGTPCYTAPEQSIGDVVDTPADIYSLGVSVFELATGHVPFREGDVAYDHRHTAPPDPREITPELPGALAELILDMLIKDPADRPDAANLIDRLAALASASTA